MQKILNYIEYLIYVYAEDPILTAHLQNLRDLVIGEMNAQRDSQD